MANIFRQIRETLVLNREAYGEKLGFTARQIRTLEEKEQVSPETLALVTEKLSEIPAVRTLLGLDVVETPTEETQVVEPEAPKAELEVVSEPKQLKPTKPEAPKAKIPKIKRTSAPKAAAGEKKGKPYVALQPGAPRPAFAQELRGIREAKHMSQKQFGEALGISASLLAQLETQDHARRPDLIAKAEALVPLEGEMCRHETTPVDPELAKLAKMVRKAHALSLKEMGVKIGRSGPMVYGFESGKRGIPSDIKATILKMRDQVAEELAGMAQ